MNGVIDVVAKRNQLGNWETTETLPTAVTAKETTLPLGAQLVVLLYLQKRSRCSFIIG
jgi:hypothetical protein